MERATVTEYQWPTTSVSLLADMERLAAGYDPSQVNQPLLALIRARKALNDARLCVSAAKRYFKEREDVTHRLVEITDALGKAHDDFPLTVLENGGGKPRPKIFSGT